MRDHNMDTSSYLKYEVKDRKCSSEQCLLKQKASLQRSLKVMAPVRSVITFRGRHSFLTLNKQPCNIIFRTFEL
jgi:hypothetical protein